MKMVFTALEAAAMYGVSYQTIYRRMNEGSLKSYRIPGSNQRRIRRQDLLRFFKRMADPSRPRPSGKVKVMAIHEEEAVLEAADRAFGAYRWFEFQAIQGRFTFLNGSLLRKWQPDLVLIDSRRRGSFGRSAAQAILGDPGLADCRIVHLVGPDDPGLPSSRRGREAVLKAPFDADRILEASCKLLAWEAPIVHRDAIRLQALNRRNSSSNPSTDATTNPGREEPGSR